MEKDAEVSNPSHTNKVCFVPETYWILCSGEIEL
jgi:hypothetical protein